MFFGHSFFLHFLQTRKTNFSPNLLPTNVFLVDSLHIRLCHTTLHCTESHRTTLQCTTYSSLHCTSPPSTTPHHSALCCTTPHRTKLNLSIAGDCASFCALLWCGLVTLCAGSAVKDVVFVQCGVVQCSVVPCCAVECGMVLV